MVRIEKVSLSKLNPAPYNPRLDLKPGDPDYEKLKRSIDEFGCVEVLVWNEKTGNLVSGHQRMKILLERGIKEVEVSVVNLSLPKEKQLNLILNRIRGDWDDEKLQALVSELAEIPDFDLTLTGFDVPEISEILDRAHESKEDDFDLQKELDSIEKPITKSGDLIELGPHRILCGSSDNMEDVQRLFGDEKADLLHTDPPYGCAYLAQNRPDLESRPKKSKRWEKLYKDDLNEEEYEKWLEAVLKNITPHLKKGASAYIWNGHAKFYFMHQAMRKLGFHISTVITWAKPNFAISYGDFNQQTEFCLYSWLENGPHRWYGPTNETNLWEIDREKTADLIHPTQKSTKIPARAIRNSTLRGDIVADIFMGSGATLIAAESLERRCFGMEIEPKYCDAIVRRFIRFAPGKASKDVEERYMKGVASEK